MNTGLYEVSGLLREGDTDLVIEYQTKLIGLIRSEIKVVYIPFEDIEDIEAKSNIFQSQIRIVLNTLRNIGDFPVPNQGDLVLNIHRKNREQARSFVRQINLASPRFDHQEDEDELV